MVRDLDSRYTVRGTLGTGGTGRVLRVYDSVRERDLALKVVAQREAAWLRKEFGALRNARHENIIQVFDWGMLQEGGAYYTMELVDGASWGERQGSQPQEEVLRITAGVLRGVAHLHSHGEIHGDLKPGNVLLSRSGTIKVADVGMGELSQQGELTYTTPGYTAPEVWEGTAPSVRADLYSVGVMAFEALTGMHPFGARTVREVVTGQLEGWVPSPSVYGVHLPAHMERALMRALDRNPNLRPGSADELMDGLGIEDRVGEILGGQIVGRQREVSHIEASIVAKGPGRHTLMYVIGPPGVGKAALLDEVADHVAGKGLKAVSLHAPDFTLAGFVGAVTGRRHSHLSATDEGLAEAAELILAETRGRPLFAWMEECPEQFLSTVVRPLARWLWAVSLEGDVSHLLVALARADLPAKLDPFESEVRLEPLSSELLDAQVVALLGGVEKNAALSKWLLDLSGGLPGTLLYLIKAIVKDRIIVRERGIWVLRNTEELTALSIPGVEDQWGPKWDALPNSAKDTLVVIGLLDKGIHESDLLRLAEAIGSPDLKTLEIRGWVRHVHGRWILASESIRRTVSSKGMAQIPQLARAVLSAIGGGLSREERASLAICSTRDTETLSECLWAAARLEQLGDTRKAAELYEAGLLLARELGEIEAAGRISLKLAEALLQSGDTAQAEMSLSDVLSQSPERLLLLGRIHVAKGSFSAARAAFQEAVAQAEKTNNKRLALRGYVDLSELEWRYGSDQSRVEAIERGQDTLERLKDSPELAEEKAALAYGIGSALVVRGEAQRAKPILEAGLAQSKSDFWRARIANALGAASGVRGENEAALRWYDVAWAHVESARLVSLKSRILANKGAILHAKGELEIAVGLDRQAAGWALRMGDKFEYMAACAGTAIGLIYMGVYEEALVQARASSYCALELGDDLDRIKGLELEALALFHVGAFGEATKVVEEALAISARLGGTRLTGRVLWLKARLEKASGNVDGATTIYEAAEREIAALEDLEDLLGIQIEREALGIVSGDEMEGLRSIARLAEKGAEAGLTVVYLSGVLSMAEILGQRNLEYRSRTRLCMRALELAEGCGFYEMAWRLSYWLAELAFRDGDIKLARSRYAHTIRVIRGIADRLSAERRLTYLESPHVSTVFRSALGS